MSSPATAPPLADPPPLPAGRPHLAGLRATHEPDFDYLSDAYGALFERSGADAFRHPLWLDGFYRRLAPARGAAPATVALRDAEGRLRGVLPLILRRKAGLRLLETADLGVSDYAAPVFEPGAALALVRDPAIGAAIRAALPAHDVLRIRPVRPEWVEAWRLALGAAPRPLGFSAHEARPTVPYRAWREAAMTPSHRRYLDRRAKRLAKAGGGALVQVEDGEAAAAAVARIAGLRAGRFAGDPIQGESVAAFYAEVARRGAASGFCRIYELRLGDEALATILALVHGGRLLYLLIGCDYARHGRHSPGLLLYDRLMARFAEEGGEVFDFTIGDEPFKRDFGTAAVPMTALVATPTMRGRAGLALFEARERLAGAMRERRDGRTEGTRGDDDTNG